MAKNQVYNDGEQFAAVCSDPAVPVSGDAVIVGQMPAVALTNEHADGTTSIKTNGVYKLPVKGVDGAGNSAVAAGDILYYTAGDPAPKVSKKNTGVRFGYALAAVGAGATATIPVKIGY